MKKILSAVLLTVATGFFIVSTPAKAKHVPQDKVVSTVQQVPSSKAPTTANKGTPKELSGMKVVSFGADWCAACRELEPELARYKSENSQVEVLKIELEQLEQEEFRKYLPLLTSRSIPYTVILDSEGNKRAAFVGIRTAAEISDAVDYIQNS